MPNIDITRIAGNIGALNALNSLNYVNNTLAVHQRRLSTGKRLNEAADDPAGYNMALTFDIRRGDMKVALNAIGDAKNYLAIAEAGLRKITDILVTLKNKVMEAAGGTIGTDERKAIAAQMNQYAQEIDQIAADAEWNGQTLLDGKADAVTTGTTGSGVQFFVGVSGSAGTANFADFKFSGTDARTGAFGVTTTAGSAGGFTSCGLGLRQGTTSSSYNWQALTGFATTATGPGGVAGSAGTATLNSINNALKAAKYGLVELGSIGARLSFKEDALMVAYINTEAAYNRIMNADMAEEQVNASKYLILQQTATAMLAQANMAPQFLLSLFR